MTKKWFGPYYIAVKGFGVSQHKTLSAARKRLKKLKEQGATNAKIKRDYFVGHKRRTEVF